MHVERFGAGNRVFYGLHGWNGDHRTFLPLLPCLPPDATLIAPDLPGCGRSPAPARWTLEEVAASIARSIVEESGAGPVVLIGNCSGGLLGMAAVLSLGAHAATRAIGRLVLIDPFAYWPWYFRVFLAGGWGRYAFAATFANPAGRFLTNQALRSRRRPETDLTEGFARADRGALWNYLALLDALGPMERFRSLRMPVDIVHGERTFGAVRRSIPRWLEIWPHARVWTLPGAGHLPIREAAGDLGRVIFGGEVCPRESMPSSGNTRR